MVVNVMQRDINDFQFITPKELPSSHHQVYSDDFIDLLTVLKDFNSRRIESLIVPGTLPFLTLTTPVVELFFTLCSSFRMPPEVKFMALEVFDRFNAHHFSDLWNFLHTSSANPSIQMKHWQRLLPRARKQSLLRVVSSIQVASKFVLQSSALSGKTVQKLLTKCGHTYSLNSVYNSEIRVFSLLGCQVLQHWADVQQFLPTCEKVLSYTFLQREEIYIRFFWLGTSRWEKFRQERLKFAAVELDNVLLASAVLVSSLYIHKFSGLTPKRACEILSDIGNISSDEIRGLAIIITQTALGGKSINSSSFS